MIWAFGDVNARVYSTGLAISKLLRPDHPLTVLQGDAGALVDAVIGPTCAWGVRLILCKRIVMKIFVKD